MSSFKLFVACVVSLFIAPGLVQADVVRITGDVNAGTGQIIFDNDIFFTIQTSGNVLTLTFDEWTTTDGTQSFANLAGSGSVFQFSINGGATQTSTSGLVDNLNATIADISPNDGYVYINSSPAVLVGDTFTVKAGSYSLDATTNFNPLLNDFSFNGQAFLTDGSGNRLSDFVTSIPEPATAGIIGLAIFGFCFVRRRK